MKIYNLLLKSRQIKLKYLRALVELIETLVKENSCLWPIKLHLFIKMISAIDLVIMLMVLFVH
jgi:hypothetical protein